MSNKNKSSFSFNLCDKTTNQQTNNQTDIDENITYLVGVKKNFS